MEREKLISKVKEMLTENRFKHTLGVEKKAVELARTFGEDVYRASIAALLHDCARDMDAGELIRYAEDYKIALDKVTLEQIELAHGPVGAAIAAHWLGVDDEDVLRAVSIHTTGDTNMTLLDKIIYLADIIEEGRNFSGVEDLRRLALRDLDRAVLKGMDLTLVYIIQKGEMIHKKTVLARNELLYKIKH